MGHALFGLSLLTFYLARVASIHGRAAVDFALEERPALVRAEDCDDAGRGYQEYED